MSYRKQTRSISRELVLLSLSQTIDSSKEIVIVAIALLIKSGLYPFVLVLMEQCLKANIEKLEKEQLNRLVLAAIRTLVSEIQDTLENAAAEVKRGSDRLNESETRAISVQSAKAMVEDALELAQTAINRLGYAIELPEFIQLSSQYEVREYALELLVTISRQNWEIEKKIEADLVAWQFNRLPKIDRDILKIAVAEILYLDVPKKVAINEAVELAKRYSDEEGYRLINGVLRRVTDRLKVKASK